LDYRDEATGKKKIKSNFRARGTAKHYLLRGRWEKKTESSWYFGSKGKARRKSLKKETSRGLGFGSLVR